MYWPIGYPNIYAVSGQAAPGNNDSFSSGDPEVSEQFKPFHTNGSNTAEDNTSPSNGQSKTPGPPLGVEWRARHRAERSVIEAASIDDIIISAKPSRGGSIFATITNSSLTIWESKPTVALASISRSEQSLKAYGANADLLFRPDALVVVVQTTQNFFIIYSLAADPNARVYQGELFDPNRATSRAIPENYSAFPKLANSAVEVGGILADGDGIREVNLRFRMVMRIDAGISATLALEDELIVATRKPVALQCIQWPKTDNSGTRVGPQTRTELLSRMSWLPERCSITAMVYDRPMNLSCWVTDDGRTYAAQRCSPANDDTHDPASLFQGYCFHRPASQDIRDAAVTAAVNARFSLIAVGCADGQIRVYVVKDYTGNIPLSHTHWLPVTSAASGSLQCLTYSPDGHCIFAGYENGWAMWSVYGKPGATSFARDRSLVGVSDDRWLHGIITAFWIGSGCELVILGPKSNKIWSLDVARSAMTGCFTQGNLARGLLQCSSHLKLYRGHQAADPTNFSSDASLWQTIQIPPAYIAHYWPIKYAVVSSDSKYIAVAGRRGLAHYSVISGRWRAFDDPISEREFCVRGGMCWFGHFLLACVESDREGKKFQVRAYAREKALNSTTIQHTESLTAPAIFISTSGSDSLLVYTHDNVLLHYILKASPTSLKLVQVGSIGFHGIIKAPPRVRAVSWLLSEEQLRHGDPTQDVSKASVLFLVDGKLVLLQPSTNEHGELKYDMRVIAQNVEYFLLLRDCSTRSPSFTTTVPPDTGLSLDGTTMAETAMNSLGDSLWYFDGSSINMWLDVQDVLSWMPGDTGAELPSSIQIPVDFYPLFAIATLGVVYGLDTDLVQRKDIDFSFFRLASRTQLFLPSLLRHHLIEYNSPAALHLSQIFRHLPYFPHALEVLLHDVLDSEVDSPPASAEMAMLPTAISFLSSFPSYLDVVVNCTRKTELRSWKTLFSSLPPILDLFEQSLVQGKLKTAAGYLLVFHTLQGEDEHGTFEGYEYARLLRAASLANDWELCSELARFLVGIDDSGKTLEAALFHAGLDGNPSNGDFTEQRIDSSGNEDDIGTAVRTSVIGDTANGVSQSHADYFSLPQSNG